MLCQLHQRLHGCGAERNKRAGDQGLDHAKGAGCAEGLSIVEEVPVVESEAIVDVKSGFQIPSVHKVFVSLLLQVTASGHTP